MPPRRFDDEVLGGTAEAETAATAEPAAAPVAEQPTAAGSVPAAEPGPCIACNGNPPYPAWNCGACGRRHPDWANRKKGARCANCGIDVPFVHRQCPVCDAVLHQFPAGSEQCAENQGCHPLRPAEVPDAA